MLRLIVCDWNGTLFRDTLEEAYFVGLCRRVLWRSLWPLRVRKAASIAVAGVRCYAAYLRARFRPQGTLRQIGRIIELLNGPVFAGISAAELEAYTVQYGYRVRSGLDWRLLDPLRAIHDETRVPLGVISSGCRRGIAAALSEAGCEFDFILANDFRMDGEAVGAFEFTLTDNKWEILRGVLAERGIDPRDVMYIGDSEQDAACMENVGFPVLSFWARPAVKEQFARQYGAFAPADEEAFEQHVRAAIGVGR